MVELVDDDRVAERHGQLAKWNVMLTAKLMVVVAARMVDDHPVARRR